MTVLRPQTASAPKPVAILNSASKPSVPRPSVFRSAQQTPIAQRDISQQAQLRSAGGSEDACEAPGLSTATQSSEASSSRGMSPFVSTGLLLAPLLSAGPALAATRTDAEQLFKTVAGAGYVLLVCFFFYRLFKRRVESGTSQSLRSQITAEQPQQDAEQEAIGDKEVTPGGAIWGAFQAGVICYLLFQVCGLVDGYFSRQEMPDQFTARNITVTLRTVIRGLAYLVTFLFGANCVGLTGLSIQLLISGGSSEQEPTEQE